MDEVKACMLVCYFAEKLRLFIDLQNLRVYNIM